MLVDPVEVEFVKGSSQNTYVLIVDERERRLVFEEQCPLNAICS